MAHLVLADDEGHIRYRLREALEAAGHTVRLARSGTEALELIREELPDLAVIDMRMPYVDGFEVLQRLRAAPESQGLPVIILTGKCADAEVFHSWECSIWTEDADTLTKPFEPLRLLQKIDWLTRTRRAAPLVLMVGTPAPSWQRIGGSLSDAGLRVFVARSLQIAGEWIDQLKPDLVITERVTPDLEAALTARPELPVVTPTGARLHPGEGEALLQLILPLLREVRP